MKKIDEESSWIRNLTENKPEWRRKTFCEVIHEVSRAYPDNIAVQAGKERVTYRELMCWAKAVAQKLDASGLMREEIVAVKTGRTIETVAGILGIWKAGGAYVYLDKAYPKVREDSILKECKCRFILDEVWWRDVDRENELPEMNRSVNNGLAALIYTSGSTSKPKGVMLEHRSVVSAMYNFQIFDLKPGEAFGIFPGLGFVAAISDFFSTLAAGAAAVIIPGEIRRSIAQLVEFYQENEIRVTYLPPHMARKLLQMEVEQLPLRLLLVGSEPVRNLKKAPFRILNVYGASETCSLAAYYEISDSNGGEIYPIGKLKEGLKGYLAAEDGSIAEPGETGELWISGPQISRGYYCLPDLTKTCYVANPFSQEPGYEYVFKTSDMMKELPDGNLQYVCRKDNVYKIRGFRVESSAVEYAISSCASVKDAVVLAFMDDGGCNILCGYFTADEKLDVKKMKEKLKNSIPYYMVPTCLIQLDAFPLNVNSKIDRKALKPPKELNDHKLLEKLY